MVDVRPIVLATGGTGGHVFPAEALAGELEARGVPFTLVTDSRGRQWQGALSRRPIHYIHSASPTGSLARRLQALLLLGLGLFDAWRALGRLSPAAVVGFGGYASVPTMIAARLRRTPAMVHEQNAVLGKANRMVVSGVARVATSFAQTRFVGDKAQLVGNPVRDTVRALRGTVYRAPGPDRIIDLLVFGGSQGAASFSQVIPDALLSLPAPLTDAAASRFASDLVGGDAASADRLVVSIGSVADGLDGLLGSVQEATDLSRGARPRGVRAAVLRRADERPLMRLVTSLRDDHRLLRHSERMLQPLIEYDLARDGDLLHVLGAVVAHPGNRTAAAAASHLSRSVFYQRLALIGDLLGADLDDGETLTGLHLALLVRRSAAS